MKQSGSIPYNREARTGSYMLQNKHNHHQSLIAGEREHHLNDVDNEFRQLVKQQTNMITENLKYLGCH